jgi:hypothetical protein
MKQFIVAIFLCVAFSALVNAAERKIAYDRGGEIFVANADGTHSKKIAEGTWPEISPDGKALLMDVDCGSEHERKNWTGHSPRLKSWILVLTRRFASRARTITFGNRFG